MSTENKDSGYSWPEIIFGITFIIAWVYGVVLAESTGRKVAATFIPPYGWYLIVDKIDEKYIHLSEHNNTQCNNLTQ